MDKTCRNCAHLYVLGTGSQIILICRVTKRDVDYNDSCSCGKFEMKIRAGGRGHAPLPQKPKRQEE